MQEYSLSTPSVGRSSSGSTSAAAGTSATGSASASPFVININWDSSVSSAPVGFTTAVTKAVLFLESQFSNPVTITIDVGYGEVMGSALGSGVLGESSMQLDSVGYSTLVSALTSHATTASDQSAVATLPSSSPVGGTFWTSTAEAKALGLLSGSSVDGAVGFSSSYPFTYDDSSGVSGGTFDFYSVALHEITEVMGRLLLDGGSVGGTSNSYTPLDLYRYSSAGVRDFSFSVPGYLSTDGGHANDGNLNTVPGGDAGDWSSSMGNDAFDASVNSGVVNSFSADDLTAMSLLGWEPTASSTPPSPPPTITTGTGSDSLVLSMGEDAWQGDAQFTVAMDGVQLGGTFTTTALQSTGVTQSFIFNGNWTAGTHTVTVTFLNDAYGGSPSTDRNLYVDGVTYDGTNTNQSAALYSDGSRNFTVTDTTGSASSPPPVTTGTGSDSLTLSMAEDAWQGDAQFTVAMDGVQLGGTFTTTALQSAGATQNFIFNGNWAVGSHTVTVTFLNDAYGGSPSTDRNLYVDGVTYDGTNTGQSAALYSNGSTSFTVNDTTAPGSSPPPVTTGTGPDSLVLNMAEDAYQGDAQFTVAVDGVQLGGTFTTTALQSAGVTQSFTFNGNWAAGTHSVTVTFLNDAYGGSPTTDRNLYVDGVTYDGVSTGQSAALYTNGSKTFSVIDTTARPSFIGGTQNTEAAQGSAPAGGVDDVFGTFIQQRDTIDLRPTLNATGSDGQPRTLDIATVANGNMSVAMNQHDTGAVSFGDVLSHTVGS